MASSHPGPDANASWHQNARNSPGSGVGQAPGFRQALRATAAWSAPRQTGVPRRAGSRCSAHRALPPMLPKARRCQALSSDGCGGFLQRFAGADSPTRREAGLHGLLPDFRHEMPHHRQQQAGACVRVIVQQHMGHQEPVGGTDDGAWPGRLALIVKPSPGCGWRRPRDSLSGCSTSAARR